MLRLMKYELKATARIMLPLYLLVILLGIGSRILGMVFAQQSSWAFQMLSVLVSVAFVLGIVAIFGVSLVLMIARFRSNLLKDEGYVMFTLPVSRHSLVWSKLLVSLIWFVGNGIVSSIAMTLSTAGLRALVQQTWESFHRFIVQESLGSAVLMSAESILLVLLALAGMCLMFYAPLAIGHSFARHKMLLSVVFFFVIQILGMALGIALVVIATGAAVKWTLIAAFLGGLTELGMAQVIFCSILAVEAVYFAVLYAITMWMLNRHLNLE